jgi:hypothetical protein
MDKQKYQIAETKTRKLIFNEISFILAIIGVVLSGLFF